MVVFQELRRTLAGAVVLGLVMVGGVVPGALAEGEAICGEIDSMENCNASARCTWNASTSTCVPVPEMSDYLAMAFVLVAGGMIYHLRSKRKADKQAS